MSHVQTGLESLLFHFIKEFFRNIEVTDGWRCFLTSVVRVPVLFFVYVPFFCWDVLGVGSLRVSNFWSEPAHMELYHRFCLMWRNVSIQKARFDLVQRRGTLVVYQFLLRASTSHEWHVTQRRISTMIFIIRSWPSFPNQKRFDDRERSKRLSDLDRDRFLLPSLESLASYRSLEGEPSRLYPPLYSEKRLLCDDW